MIALPDDMPLVRHEDGCVTAFERSWLRDALLFAAGKAGYQKWWLADHVMESVTRYLGTHFEGTVVTSERVESTVRQVLQVIGYGEVAEYFRSLPAPVWISLPELAGQAGAGYELIFFDLLRVRIREALESSASRLNVHGLSPCVKRLKGRKRWQRHCGELRDEIVGFIRTQIRAHPKGEETLVTMR